MNDQNQRGFFGIIIPKEILDDTDLNVAEKFVYGYIASFPKCCFESNEKIAKKLGVSESTVAHAIPELVRKSYLFVEKKGNNSAARRIYAVFDNPKKLAYLAKKGMFAAVEKGMQNLHTPLQNLHEGMQDLQTSKTGVSNAKFADIDIEEKKNKAETAVSASNEPTGGFNFKRSEFESDGDFEEEFYRRNTVCLGAV